MLSSITTALRAATASLSSTTGSRPTTSVPTSGSVDDTPALTWTVSTHAQAMLNGSGTSTGTSPADQPQSSAQDALSRLEQIAQSGRDAAKNDAKARVERIKQQIAQLQKLRAMFSPKDLKRILAQLAKQLATAAAEYGAGQTGGTTTENAAPGPSANSTTANPEEDDSAQNGADDLSAQQDTPTPSSSGRPQTSASHDGHMAEDSAGFRRDVQALARQIKALLAQIRRKEGHRFDQSDDDASQAQSFADEADSIST